MIIENIKVHNMDIIVDALNQSRSSKRQNINITFKNKLPELAKLMGIYFKFTKVSTLELYFLKMMCSSLTVLSESTDAFVFSDNVKINDQLRGAYEIHKEIRSTLAKSHEYPHLSDNFLPIGSNTYTVEAYFTGSHFLSITGVILESIIPFDALTDTFGFDEKNKMEDVLSNVFMSSFHNSMIYKLTTHDILSDYMFSKFYYKYIENSTCSIAEIGSHKAVINLFGKSKDEVTNMMQEYISMNNKNAISERYITLVAQTTFSTFMDIYINLNKYVIDNENFTLLYPRNEVTIHESILRSHRERISSFISFMSNEKKMFVEDNKKSLNLNIYNLILKGTNIRYVLQIPLNEVNDFKSRLNPSSLEYTDLVSSIDKYISTIDSILN